MNVGMGEILLVMLVGLLVFGPNKLPEIARNLGKALRSFQQETQRAAEVLRTAVDETPAAPPPPGTVDTPDARPAPVGALSTPADDTPDAAATPPIEAPDPAVRRLEDT